MTVTTPKISKMSELFSVRFSSVRSDMTKHVFKMAAILGQLRSMQVVIEELLFVRILIVAINATKLTPVVAPIKNLTDEDVRWEAVFERLTEECRSLK